MGPGIADPRGGLFHCAQVVEQAKGRFQIIVLDHAPEGVWGDIPNIVAFEEWRGGMKLVPTEWIP